MSNVSLTHRARRRAPKRPSGSSRRAARSRIELEALEPRTLLTINAQFGHIAAAEGTPNTYIAATFDSADSTAASSYTASINWGDGTMSPGTVSTATGGGFEVTGTHTYSAAGSPTATITIADGPDSATATGNADVSPAPLTIAAVPIGAALGTAVTTEVATFTDTNPGAQASDFTATINWGDGTTSTGAVAETSGVFNVTGTHTYTSLGQFPLIVSVQGEGSFATTGFGNQVNLVSNIPGLAPTTDPQLVNPWGLTPTGEFWVADNGDGLSTLYNAAGKKAGLVVTVPAPPGQTTPSAPTGIVAGAGSTSGEFEVNGTPAFFIFDTEDGTISAWAGGAAATREVNNSQTSYGNGVVGAVYKGLAIATQGSAQFLYAANFRSGNVEVYNGSFVMTSTFTDPALTAIGYAPFGIQAINGNVFVTFAKQDAAKHDDDAGPGNGYVDEFSPAGTMIARIASQGTLNSPWGLALAPAGFGQFAGDLLVGNFGDGTINAFNLSTMKFDGQLTAAGASSPITLPGLWALQFGGGGGSATSLNFTEGLNDEKDGVFGTIAPTAQANAVAMVFDAPITIHALAFNATSGVSFTGAVASFTDTNPNAQPNTFTATINWGDNTITPGTVTETDGVFQVSGTHTYALPGSFPAIVTVHSAESFATTGFGNQTNMVSNIPGLAPTIDPALVNPWGISFNASSPFWISDNGTGLSTLYNGAGAKVPLTVTIPPPAGQSGPSAPTGTVANANASEFLVNGTPAHFLFDTEDGTISAWTGGGSAVRKVDNSQVKYPNGATGAVYKGLAIASQGGRNDDFLYATNFRSGNVDVFNNQFVQQPSFTDSSLTALGYAPFGIQNVGGNLYVTFAKQDAAKHDDVAGAGNGYIDVFSPTGVLLKQFAANGALNSPWGMAVAPVGFGPYGGDLLVGNFGDGKINVYSLGGAWLTTLTATGATTPLQISGLWGLAFGNGAQGTSRTTLYFTDGLNGEDDGIFGKIAPAPQLADAATVADGNKLTGSVTLIEPTSGLTDSGVVATFHDTDTLAPASVFVSTINWGDGSFSPGVVSGGNGTFTVSGTHTYAQPGLYVIIVKLAEAKPGTASADSIALSLVPAPTSSSTSAAVVSGTTFTPPSVKNAVGSSALALVASATRTAPAQSTSPTRFLTLG